MGDAVTTHPNQHQYYEQLCRRGLRPTLVCACGCGSRLETPVWCDYNCFGDSLAFVSWLHHNRLKTQLQEAEQEVHHYA